MTIAKRLVALFVAVFLVGAMAACSKSDDSAQKTSEQSNTKSDSGDDSSSSGDDSSSSDDDSSSNDASGIPGLGNLDDCMSIIAVWGQIGAAAGAASGQMTEQEIADYEQALDELGSEIPDELKDDVEVLSNAYAEFFAALEDGDMVAASEKITTSDVEDATTAIDDWLEANCN